MCYVSILPAQQFKYFDSVGVFQNRTILLFALSEKQHVNSSTIICIEIYFMVFYNFIRIMWSRLHEKKGMGSG